MSPRGCVHRSASLSVPLTRGSVGGYRAVAKNSNTHRPRKTPTYTDECTYMPGNLRQADTHTHTHIHSLILLECVSKPFKMREAQEGIHMCQLKACTCSIAFHGKLQVTQLTSCCKSMLQVVTCEYPPDHRGQKRPLTAVK